ncbi:FAD:protein FMN transferase [Ferrimonas lipolytica]|uniref:FAD:protein FMN transferase n=1 Tax=Ferrimonas lipolytica TaxID=2724191 RepID=A0A6H1UGA1_9GAMM|nr:FAD:protein FMN transferase [Ferrimonas lipolytica]QIZ78111.1 FAD:protein FMN transferase [Ferrimonas lipolytica]
MRVLTGFVQLFALVVSAQPALANEQPLRQFQGYTMGQEYEINWRDNGLEQQQLKQLKQSIKGTFNGIDGTMSTWRQQSELSRFNQLEHVNQVSISDHTATVIERALELGQLTSGALDITVAPLMKLWGFGANNSTQAPTRQQQLQVLEYTGLDKIELDHNQLKKRDKRVQLDLSSIAKGYGVDMVGKVLERYGINHYMIEVGGEIRTKGQPIPGQDWQVSISQPAIFSDESALTLNLSGHSIATSGDYRQFFSDANGQRYSHIIDPVSGSAKVRDVASATVIADDCTSADGLATALMVMGIDKALAFAEQQQLPVLLIAAKEGQFTLHRSSHLNQFIHR